MAGLGGFLSGAFGSPAGQIKQAGERYAARRLAEALEAVEAAIRKLEEQAAKRRLDSEARKQASEAWLLKARILRDMGRTDQALSAFRQVRRMGAADNEAITFLAHELLLREDGGDEARGIYLDYLSRARYSDSQSRLDENLALLEKISRPRLGTTAEVDISRMWLQQLLSRRDGIAWAHRYLGAIALHQGDLQAAARSLEQASKLDAADEDAGTLLAYTLAQMGRLDEAKAHLDRCVATRPSQDALLLRAGVHRKLGQAAAALEDYRHAARMGDLPPDALLALAELALGAGANEAAAEVLAGLPQTDDPRVLLLRVALDSARGNSGPDALGRLAALLEDDALRPQVIPRLLALVAAHPEAAGALDALERVPEAEREGAYWGILGNALYAAGRTEEAIEAWGHPGACGGEADLSTAGVVRRHLAEVWEIGGDAAFLEALRDSMGRRLPADEAVPAAAVALARHLGRGVSDGAMDAEAALARIAEVERDIPGVEARPEVTAVRALLHASVGRHGEAAALLGALPEAWRRRPEIALQEASCALQQGDDAAFERLLQRADPSDPRTACLRAAQAALSGDLAAALRVLDEAGGGAR